MRERLAKTLVAVAVILGLALLLAGVSMIVIRGWEDAPGGWLSLLGGVFLVVAGLGGKIKDWRELLFGEETQKLKPQNPIRNAAPKLPVQSQNMRNSPHGEQIMKGGGRQEQNMDESPHGKQQME